LFTHHFLIVEPGTFRHGKSTQTVGTPSPKIPAQKASLSQSPVWLGFTKTDVQVVTSSTDVTQWHNGLRAVVLPQTRSGSQEFSAAGQAPHVPLRHVFSLGQQTPALQGVPNGHVH
jgi:hypothetical protein